MSVEAQLKGGFVTRDPRLDRVPQFDERSRAFRAVEGIEEKPLRSYSWNKTAWLDQGSEGACVGFSISHEIAARPKVHPVDEALARRIYLEAQKIDEWPGEGYSGTSVLAGVKVAQSLGYYSEYRWCFSEAELALAVGYKGPAVLGIPWYEGMYEADGDGYVWPTGPLVGWHAILCPAFSVKLDHYRLDNSWGPGWGVNGSCYVKRQAMAELLGYYGEAMIPVTRL